MFYTALVAMVIHQYCHIMSHAGSTPATMVWRLCISIAKIITKSAFFLNLGVKVFVQVNKNSLKYNFASLYVVYVLFKNYQFDVICGFLYLFIQRNQLSGAFYNTVEIMLQIHWNSNIF
jgi:hypothetical protein